ncbi:MAG: hypothetical protein Q9182_005958 [Xanthomendoza sp. 2 TL-2023]
MLLWSTCICAYPCLLFATLIVSLTIRPQAGPPSRWIDVNLTDAELAFSRAGADNLRRPTSLGKTTWCRPPDSDLDLHFSTTGGQPVPFRQLIYAVGYFRQVLIELVNEQGKEAKCDTKSTSVKVKDIVVTVLDPLLQQRTWDELLNAFDVLLLCCFTDKLHTELRGTFFEIKTMSRLATVSVANARQPRHVESVGEA